MPKFNLRQTAVDHLDWAKQLEDKQLEARDAQLVTMSQSDFPASAAINPHTIAKRWQAINSRVEQEALLDRQTQQQQSQYRNNIEHFIGTVKIPVGIAGPLRVNGANASGDYLVPLATTEAALVASYSRGAKLISEAGGANALVINEGVTRTPVFSFDNVVQAGLFVAWAVDQYALFAELAHSTTRHGRLKDININIEGNRVYLVFEYLTADASGQNMVTFATNTIFQHILAHSPITILSAYLDGNLSGDKKPNSHSMRSVRGKKVVADIQIPAALIKKRLHTDVDKMIEFGQMTTTGSLLSGGIGVNAHYANALAALYIACGQDAACVAESAVGVTRMEKTADGDLYASVTLPNVMVGTVGGGTHLPSQKACLDILGLHGQGQAKALAEVAGALCLAGELSIVGAFCAGHFSQAHHKLARR